MPAKTSSNKNKTLIVISILIVITVITYITYTRIHKPTNNNRNATIDSNKNTEATKPALKQLFGVWRGSAYQPDVKEGWDIKVTHMEGDQNYIIDYPSIGCGGYWHLINSNARLLTFKEELTYGRGTCNDGGTIVLEMTNDHNFKYKFYYPDKNTLNASGHLYKEKSDITQKRAYIAPISLNE